MELIIRQEAGGDKPAVYQVVKRAFASAEHSDGKEHDLVDALRGSRAFVPELSLVAQAEGTVVGYILFTEIRIGTATELALAPLAVLPEYQGRGVGAALIRAGHKIAAELGYHYSVVLGSQTYYPRYGYSPAEGFGIQAPFRVPAVNFMAAPLAEDRPEVWGAVEYAEEFGI